MSSAKTLSRPASLNAIPPRFSRRSHSASSKCEFSFYRKGLTCRLEVGRNPVAGTQQPVYNPALRIPPISSGFCSGVNVMSERWAPESWRSKPVLQVPDYPDVKALVDVEAQLATFPPLGVAGG